MSLPTFLTRSGAAAVTAGLACLIACRGAAAQPPVDPEASPDAGPDAWKFSVGLGVVTHPKYPGSSERKTDALPLFSANYGRFFIGGLPDAGVPLGLGVTLLQDGPWRAGLGLGADLQKPRKESDSSRLTGLGDIDGTVSGSVFASYDAGFVFARGNLITDIGGKGEGTRVNLDLDARYRLLPQLMLSAGPGITWADRKYTQTFFGVTAAQSASSGLAQHDASSGVNSLRFGVGANYQLTPRWGLGARATFSSLRGDAGDSPITEKKSQTSFGLFTSYRF